MQLFRKSDLVVLFVIAVAVASLFLSIPGHDHRHRDIALHCMVNVRQIVGLLELGTSYPSDRNLLLYLVKQGEIQGAEQLELLFCPGDSSDREELRTSYAWRDQSLPGCRVTPGASVALICDDSADHHEGRGFVVGYTGGAARWRDKIDDWELREHASVTVGKDSIVPELRCLRTD